MDEFELFSTQAEALAFIRGFETALDAVDSTDAWVRMQPTLIATGEWRVDIYY